MQGKYLKLGRRKVQFDTAKAIELHHAGLGVRKIATQLGVSKSVIQRYLRSVPKTCSGKGTKKRTED